MSAPPVQRAPLWIRFRYSWTASRNKRIGPWMYCYWTKNLSGISRFTKGVIGSWRETERLGKDAPTNLGDNPTFTVDGVKVFIEKL